MQPAARVFDDRYRLESVTQADEHGEAWLGTDLVLARQVTIRIATDAVGLQVKAHMTGSITHGGIVRVYDFNIGPPAFLVGEFVDGSPLAHVLDSGPMTAIRVADFVTQSARALCAAHAAGITHGGLDAWNVLIDRAGMVKLTDFAGTGSELADLRALGLLARLCLERADQVPAAVSDLVGWLTNTDPARRPGDAAAVAVRAARLATEESVSPSTDGRPPPRRPTSSGTRYPATTRTDPEPTSQPLPRKEALHGATAVHPFSTGTGHSPEPL